MYGMGLSIKVHPAITLGVLSSSLLPNDNGVATACLPQQLAIFVFKQIIHRLALAGFHQRTTSKILGSHYWLGLRETMKLSHLRFGE
jgi:hypothetical protein